MFFYVDRYNFYALLFGGGGGGGTSTSSFTIFGGVNFVILFFAGTGGSEGGRGDAGGGTMFTSLSFTITGGVNFSISTFGGAGGGGGAFGNSLFCACEAIAMQTRHTGRNKIFFIIIIFNLDALISFFHTTLFKKFPLNF